MGHHAVRVPIADGIALVVQAERIGIARAVHIERRLVPVAAQHAVVDTVRIPVDAEDRVARVNGVHVRIEVAPEIYLFESVVANHEAVLDSRSVGVAPVGRAGVVGAAGGAEVGSQLVRSQRLELGVPVGHRVRWFALDGVLAGQVAEIVETPEDRLRRAGIVERLVRVGSRLAGGGRL